MTHAGAAAKVGRNTKSANLARQQDVLHMAKQYKNSKKPLKWKHLYVPRTNH